MKRGMLSTLHNCNLIYKCTISGRYLRHPGGSPADPTSALPLCATLSQKEGVQHVNIILWYYLQFVYRALWLFIGIVRMQICMCEAAWLHSGTTFCKA